jgi:hypothetical protein
VGSAIGIIENCMASDRIVIDTIVSKYCNHTPLLRQMVILKRDVDLEVSRATLDGWVLKVGELLIPMIAAMRRELISGTYIQADDPGGWADAREPRKESSSTIRGSTAAPEHAWCSTFAWVVDVRDRSGSVDSSKVFSKLTAIPPNDQIGGASSRRP